jgi:4-hydroxythreonine-4-phosphate dehydrogenase
LPPLPNPYAPVETPHARRPVRLAVTAGDPRGIGPEILPTAIRRVLEEMPELEIVVLGDEESLSGVPKGTVRHSVGRFDGSLEAAGTLSLRAIEEGVRMALRQEVDALVTGPVHKPALRSAGVMHPGQTELLKELVGAENVGMLMHAESTRLGGPFRVLLATTHIALRDVPETLSQARIEEQIKLLSHSLQTHWGIRNPRIALCALNPHASDGGLFGSEEREILGPATDSLREAGFDVSDPLPADTVFLRMVDGTADAVVVPYHDVGMAVFKTVAFGRGVNVTLGLPFPRTSPDHGTAFDRVGTGTADAGSFVEALRLATKLSLHRPESPL